jgi:hypothetical protein
MVLLARMVRFIGLLVMEAMGACPSLKSCGCNAVLVPHFFHTSLD